MSYTIRTTPRFDKSFKKLDRYTQRISKAGLKKISLIAKIQELTANLLLPTAAASGAIALVTTALFAI